MKDENAVDENALRLASTYFIPTFSQSQEIVSVRHFVGSNTLYE